MSSAERRDRCDGPSRQVAAALPALVVVATAASCVAESPAPGPTRETLPNGAVLVRYPGLPAIDSVGPEVADAHVALTIGTIDGDDPNYTFGEIRGVQPTSNGNIHVLDQQATEVRVFDSGGRYLRTIVRRGEGPGEIGGANGIFLSGDTLLWIHDTRQWSIIGVSPAGEEVRRFSKPVMSVATVWEGVFDNRGRYWNNTYHGDERSFPPLMGMSTGTGRLYYKSHELSSGAIDSVYIGELSSRLYAYSTPERPWGFLDIPFESREIVDVNPSGGFWRAQSAGYRIARTSEHGDTLIVIEVGLPIQPVTDDDRAAYVEGIVRDRPDLRREAEEGYYLGSVRLHLKRAGELWVRSGNIYTWIADEMDVPFVVRAPVP